MLTTDAPSTLASNRRTRDVIQRLQRELAVAEREVTTGRKGDVAGELGARTVGLLDLRAAFDRNERFLQNADTVSVRLETMQVAFAAIRESVGQLGIDARAALGRADNLSLGQIRLSAAAALQTALRSLNTSVAGRQLFSGSSVGTSPMVTGTEPDVAVATTIDDAVAAAGGTLGTGDVGALVAELDGMFDDSHADPARRFTGTFYRGAGAGEPDIVGQLDDATRLTYGVKADDAAFRDVLQGLHMLATVEPGDGSFDAEAFDAFGNIAVDRLQRGLGRLVDIAARTGQHEAVVERARDDLTTARGLLNDQIATLESRDPYEAALKLTALEQQLEASFSITARIARLSLVDFLR